MFSSKGTTIALNTRFLDDCGVKYLTGSDNDTDNDNNNDKNNDNNNNNNKNVCYVCLACACDLNETSHKIRSAAKKYLRHAGSAR